MNLIQQGFFKIFFEVFIDFIFRCLHIFCSKHVCERNSFYSNALEVVSAERLTTRNGSSQRPPQALKE